MEGLCCAFDSIEIEVAERVPRTSLDKAGTLIDNEYNSAEPEILNAYFDTCSCFSCDEVYL